MYEGGQLSEALVTIRESYVQVSLLYIISTGKNHVLLKV